MGNHHKEWGEKVTHFLYSYNITFFRFFLEKLTQKSYLPKQNLLNN